MSTPFQLHLLRRTFAALVAISGLGLAGAVQAQGTVTLSGASGNSCSYSTMSITPNGNVVVSCSGGPPPDPSTPGTVAFANAQQSVTPGTPKATVQITRTGGSKGSFRIALSPYGAACWGQPNFVDILDGATSASVEMTMGNVADTFCELTMASIAPTGATTGAAIGANKTVRVSVTSNPNPDPPPVSLAGCPTGFVPPENMQSATFGGPGNYLSRKAKSAQVTSIVLPALPDAWPTGQVTFGEDASTSGMPGMVLEISINKCPGLIDTDQGNACNVRSQFPHNNSITWLGRAFGGISESTSTAILTANGLCWAGSAGTQYYVNSRWTFPVCAYGEAGCGFAIQWNQGGIR